MSNENTENCILVIDDIKEKRPDNPMFDAERERNRQYDNGLEEQVRQVMLRYPEKYAKYQEIGKSYMNCSYDLEAGVDMDGDITQAQLLLYSVRDYILDDSELGKEELKLLIRIYGDNWREKIDELE